MTRVTVVGYASRDHAMAVEAFLGTAGTTLVRRRLSCPWPGNGGVAYALRAIAANGLAAQAVSWVGDDEDGAAWTADLRAAGVDVTGVSVVGERTPAAWLLSTSGGKTACIYDPGDCRPNELTAVQRGIVHDADWCVVMAGPCAATRTVLAALPPGSGLAWAVKNDPDAFPPDLVSALLARARVVTYGGDEHDFLAAAIAPGRVEDRVAAGGLLVQTRGSRGVRWRSGARGGEVAVRRIDAEDTTGAGDTLVGAVVSAVADDVEPASAVQRGIAAAAGLLADRAARRGNGPEP